MIYLDNKEMYGITEINDFLISKLLRSSEVLRLHGVNQYGYKFVENFYPHAKTASRFQHTLGVLSLCKMFNLDVFNQIFAVLHDLAHTAFSHVGDIVMQGFKSDQNHHDIIREEYIKNSELPVVLEKYGINIDFILNPANFPLVKCEQPYISADNLDYCLRFGLDFKIINEEKAHYFLSRLFIENNRWIFKDFESAVEFAEFVLKINDEYFCGWQSAKMMQTAVEWLRYALEKGYLGKNDLYSDDETVTSKINANFEKDAYLAKLFIRMNNPCSAEVYNMRECEGVGNLNLKKIRLKSRAIDPLFINEQEGGHIHSLSQYDITWRYKFEKSKLPREYCINFFD